MDINGSLFDWINELGGHLSLLDQAMVLVARYGVFVITGLASMSWFARSGSGGSRRLAVYSAFASAALALEVALMVQHFYVHQRPFVLRQDVVLLMHHSADPSFPSEHTTVGFALAAGSGLHRPRLGVVLLILAAATAFARVYVGVHYPADVAGGAAIGVMSALVLWLLRPVLIWIDRRVIISMLPGFLH